MQSHIRQQIKQVQQKDDPDALITRSQMVSLARQHKLFITKSTIHRWANEVGFPYAIGMEGQAWLYRQSEFLEYIKRKLRKITE